MALSTKLTITVPEAAVTVHPTIYGQYFEHVEDCITPGVIDEHGVRQDVIEAARDLGVPIVRWPGGSFADTYHWQDGIGEDRPVRPNWHWGEGQLEDHRFGTHEFLDWCEQVGAAPYLNVNLGSGDLIEALRWLDYTTGNQDTTDVLTRRRNGRDEPWPVEYWGIGNETWGTWEAGCTDAATYATTLANWATFFRRQRPEVRIVAVGSHAADDPEWDRTVLEVAGSEIDLLSVHLYGCRVNDPIHGLDEASRRAVLLAPLHFDRQIEAMGSLVRQHNTTATRQVGIAVDEWNIRHFVANDAGSYDLDRAAPRTGIDALFAAGVFHAMIRHADLVTLANYVFLVNGNAVLDARDGQVRRSTLFPMFQRYRQRLVGERLDVVVEGATLEVPRLTSGRPHVTIDPATLPGHVPAVDAVAVRDQHGHLQLAIINRSEQAVELSLDLPDTWQRSSGAALVGDGWWVDLTDDTLHHTDPAPVIGTLLLPPASCWMVTGS